MSGADSCRNFDGLEPFRDQREPRPSGSGARSGDAVHAAAGPVNDWGGGSGNAVRDPADTRNLRDAGQHFPQKKRRLSEGESEALMRFRELRCERLDLSELPPLMPANDMLSPAAALTPSGAISATISETELRLVQTIAEFGQNTNTPRILAAIQEHHQKDLLGMPAGTTLGPSNMPSTLKPSDSLLSNAAPAGLSGTLDAMSSPALSRDSVPNVPDSGSITPPMDSNVEPLMPGSTLEWCRQYARQISCQYVDELRRRMRGSCRQCAAPYGSCSHRPVDRDAALGEWSALSPSRRRIAKNRETAAVSRFRKKVYMESLERAIMNLERKYMETRNELAQLRKLFDMSVTPVTPMHGRAAPATQPERRAEADSAARPPLATAASDATGALQLMGAVTASDALGMLDADRSPPNVQQRAPGPVALAAEPAEPSPRLLEGFLRPLLASVGIEGENAANAISGAMTTALQDAQSRYALLHALRMCAGTVAGTHESEENVDAATDLTGLATSPCLRPSAARARANSCSKSPVEDLAGDASPLALGRMHSSPMVSARASRASDARPPDSASSGA